MTREQLDVVAIVVLIGSLGGAALTLIVIAGRWAMSRVEVPAEVERFTDAIVPENADVLAQQEELALRQREAMEAEMCDLLDGAMADLDALVAEDTDATVAEIEAMLDDCALQVRRMGRRAVAA